MSDSERELGVFTVTIERFADFLLPRALDIKAKVDSGGRFDDFDIEFLENVMVEAEQAKPYLDRHPDLHDLYTRAVSLYHDIVTQAAANETGALIIIPA
ncbi:hypothetical protein, partial [uncultured Lamprocystis sp.]